MVTRPQLNKKIWIFIFGLLVFIFHLYIMWDIPLHVVFVEARIKKWDKFLLAKRSSKDDQAAWKRSIPWGKLDMELENHIIENALKREVLEEVGVVVDDFTFLWSRSFIRSSGHHVVGLSFLAEYKEGEPQALDDQDEVRRVEINEVEELLDDHRGHVIKKLKNDK